MQSGTFLFWTYFLSHGVFSYQPGQANLSNCSFVFCNVQKKKIYKFWFLHFKALYVLIKRQKRVHVYCNFEIKEAKGISEFRNLNLNHFAFAQCFSRSWPLLLATVHISATWLNCPEKPATIVKPLNNWSNVHFAQLVSSRILCWPENILDLSLVFVFERANRIKHEKEE